MDPAVGALIMVALFALIWRHELADEIRETWRKLKREGK